MSDEGTSRRRGRGKTNPATIAAIAELLMGYRPLRPEKELATAAVGPLRDDDTEDGVVPLADQVLAYYHRSRQRRPG